MSLRIPAEETAILFARLLGRPAAARSALSASACPLNRRSESHHRSTNG